MYSKVKKDYFDCSLKLSILVIIFLIPAIEPIANEINNISDTIVTPIMYAISLVISIFTLMYLFNKHTNCIFCD